SQPGEALSHRIPERPGAAEPDVGRPQVARDLRDAFLGQEPVTGWHDDMQSHAGRRGKLAQPAHEWFGRLVGREEQVDVALAGGRPSRAREPLEARDE